MKEIKLFDDKIRDTKEKINEFYLVVESELPFVRLL